MFVDRKIWNNLFNLLRLSCHRVEWSHMVTIRDQSAAQLCGNSFAMTQVTCVTPGCTVIGYMYPWSARPAQKHQPHQVFGAEPPILVPWAEPLAVAIHGINFEHP